MAIRALWKFALSCKKLGQLSTTGRAHAWITWRVENRGAGSEERYHFASANSPCDHLIRNISHPTISSATRYLLHTQGTIGSLNRHRVQGCIAVSDGRVFRQKRGTKELDQAAAIELLSLVLTLVG